MIAFGYEIRVRTPIHVDRVHPWYCDRCQRHRALTRDGRCPRVDCYGLLRKVLP